MFNKRYTIALDKVYKKVIGKEYRDKMIHANESKLHASISNMNKENSEFDFYSTSHETYNDQYKIFTKNLKSNSLINIENNYNYNVDIICSFILALFVPLFIIILMQNSMALKVIFGTIFGIAIMISLLMIITSPKELKKYIYKAGYEKAQILTFFEKYKAAIGLQETSLFLTSNEDQAPKEIECGSIKKVFLTDADEKIEFTEKYITGEVLPEKTIIETDKYKTSKVRKLNLLMPDNTIFSIIEPYGANGERIEDLRDIIETRMKGTPVSMNDYTHTADNERIVV